MSVVYNGDHSIDFFNLTDTEALCMNSWDDFHLIPATRPYVANPEVQLQSVNVPLTNRRIDITSHLPEGRTYTMRQGQWEFIIDHDKWSDWASCYRALVQYFHGFKMAARLKDHDLERIYKGRIVVQSYAPGGDYSRIVLQYYFENGRVTDYGDLNMVFNVAWVTWSGQMLNSSRYSWGATPSYSSAPSGMSFSPSTSVVKSNQVYKESNADDEPTSIEVLVKPNKLQYDYGETMDYDGMIVVAYTKTGHRYTGNGRYPNGVIPNSELTLSTTTAPIPDQSGKAAIPVRWNSFTTSFEISVEVSIPEYISVVVLPTNIYYAQGDTINYTGITVVAYDRNGHVWENEDYPDGIIPYNELIFDVRTAPAPTSGVTVSLPVEWRTPDNRVLETSFEINVGIIIYNRQYKSSSFSTFDGYNVIKISNSEAFMNCSNLISVDFPVCSYIGGDAFYGCSSLTNISFPVCSYIGGYAFNNCSSLTSISFPVCSYIGSRAFFTCSSLTSISFPVCRYISEYAFYNCSLLTSISFPVCSYIGYYAFWNCLSLTNISFPVCSYIGRGAFIGCSSLTSAIFPVCSYIGSRAFSTCSSLTSISFPVCSYIGNSAFYNCSLLTSISFPVCSYIGSTAFYGCISLTNISFPVCSYIGGDAFCRCISLTSAIFLECSYIDAGAFYNCSSLSSAIFPVCSYIGTSAFYNCSSLSSAIFPVCSYIGSRAFNGCTSLTSAIFPECSHIDEQAFYSCSSLTNISFPVCSYIGGGAFGGCASLTSAIFPVCSYIWSRAFSGCTSLTSAIFPVCSYIGSSAFYNCSSLQYLTIGGSSVISYNGGIGLATTPMSAKSIWSSAISSYIYVPYPWTESNPIEFGSIYVPASLINDYMVASGWSYYSSRFAAI